MTSIYEQFYIVFQMDIHGIDAQDYVLNGNWDRFDLVRPKKIQLKYTT